LKNHGRLQTGGNGLADIDAARNYHAIDRRGNRAVLKIGFRFIQCSLFNFHIGLGLVKVRYRLVDVRLRRRLSGKEILGPLCVDPG
jgi:hypothetical protein